LKEVTTDKNIRAPKKKSLRLLTGKERNSNASGATYASADVTGNSFRHFDGLGEARNIPAFFHRTSVQAPGFSKTLSGGGEVKEVIILSKRKEGGERGTSFSFSKAKQEGKKKEKKERANLQVVLLSLEKKGEERMLTCEIR